MPDANSMNVDDEDGPGQPDSDDDVAMDSNTVTHHIDEDGWFVTAPVATTSTNNQTTNAGAAETNYAEDTTGETTNYLANTSSQPRTTRFTEIQSRSDDLMIQDLMNTLHGQIHRTGEGLVIPSTDAAERHGAADQITQFAGPHFVNNPSSNPLVRPQLFHSEQPAPTSLMQPHSVSTAEHSQQSGGPAIVSREQQNETSNVSQHDFMRFVRSVESLSASVRALVLQGGNSNERPSSQGGNSNGRPSSQGIVEVDDREDASRRVPKKRSVEENKFHDIMRNLLVDHGLWISKQRKQFSLKESVAKGEVDEYEAGSHEGPTLDNLQMDWTESMSSQWNSAAIYLLTCHILDRIKNNYYADLKYEEWMTTKRVFDEFRAKLSTSKEEYVDIMASNASDTNIDAAVQRARHAAKKRLKGTRNRRNMRRKTLYNCRLKIIMENLDTHPTWENALQLMHAVGDRAMSDDETDNERSTRRKKVVRRVEKQWASTPFKIMLNTLDLYYSRFYFDGVQKPGPGPRDRLTTIVSESPRSTPRCLPRNCYNDLYISGLTAYQRSLLRFKRDMVVPSLPLPPV